MRGFARPVVAFVVALGVAASHAPGAYAQVKAAAGAQASDGGAALPDASTRAERQITRLHKRLGITAAQAPQWTAFASVMRENAQHMDSLTEQRLQGAATRSAVDEMASYAALAKAHGEDVGRLVTPFSELYATMSDAQKKTADTLFRRAEDRHATRAPRG